MNNCKALFIFAGLLLWPWPAQGQSVSDWETYRKDFISPDGRLIDFAQNRASHSEGQGYGMLLAAIQGDASTFSSLGKWTRDNLQVRKGDFLHAWKWGRRPNGLWTVEDYNNATDGDILIAWALLRAAKKWNREEYRREAREVLGSIRKHLLVERQNHLYVLPGYFGFAQKEESIVVNPSYLVLPAFKEFAEVEEPAIWRQVHQDSLDLLEKTKFGRLKLPADWVRLNHGTVSVLEERSRFFGYEAIRILLHLVWDGHLSILPGCRAILDVYKKLGYVPLKFDLLLNNISLEEAPAGYYALYSRVAREIGEGELGRSLWNRAQEKIRGEKEDYYSRTLYLLAQGTWKP
jgi:endo-1,4-beta-D-glucanase Y